MIVIVTSDVLAVQGALLIVQRSITGPAPPVCVKVEPGKAAFEKVPAPPLTMLQAPVPAVGVLPPRPVVVPFAQIVCGPPTAAVVGAALIVIVTLAVEAVQGALLIVQRTITGPAPPVCVKVALGVVALGLKEPVPPLTTVHAPVPIAGVLPPSPRVVPFVQIVCAPPTVAAVGGWLIVTVASAVDAVQGVLVIIQRRITGPAPPV